MSLRATICGASIAFVVLTCLVYMADTGARYTGYLRTKTSAAVHEQIEPAYLHGEDGRAKLAFGDDEPIYVRERFRKLQSCHMFVSSIFRRSDKNLVYRGETYYTWMQEKDYNFSENIPRPAGIPAGDYRLIRKTVAFCGGDQVFYTLNFDLPIRLEEKKAGRAQQSG